MFFWGWGDWVLLMRSTAEGKKLFLWCEVLVSMDRSLVPEDLDRWQTAADGLVSRVDDSGQ